MNKAIDYLDKIVEVKIDRPLGSLHPKYDFRYEVNYGFIPGTKAEDGEEIDAYIIGNDQPLETFEGKCVAVILRTNDNDDKLVVVPENFDITDNQIREKTNFQEKYFKSKIIRKKGNS